MSEILYGFMFVGIVLANVIVLADDNWRGRQLAGTTDRSPYNTNFRGLGLLCCYSFVLKGGGV